MKQALIIILLALTPTIFAQTVTKTSTFVDKYGNVGEGEDKWTITYASGDNAENSTSFDNTKGIKFWHSYGKWILTSERYYTNIQSISILASISSSSKNLFFIIEGVDVSSPWLTINKSTTQTLNASFSPKLNGHLGIEIPSLKSLSYDIYIKSISVTYTPTANEQTVTLNESNDNGSTVNSNVSTSETVTVNLNRALTADMWNAICLPFSMSTPQQTALFGAGYKLKEFTGVDDTDGISLKFTDVKGSTVTGKPYIVLPTVTRTASETVSISGVAITNSTPGVTTVVGGNGTYTYQGIYAPTVIEKNNMRYRFIGANNKLYYSTSDNPMRAFRCYFTLPEESASSSNVALSIDEEGISTKISAAEVQEMTVGSDCVYTLTGQFIGTEVPSKRGIYLVGGKKILVR